MTYTDDNLIITHLWVDDFGWENTVFIPSDFSDVELLGQNEQDGKIFIAIQENGIKRIVKGYLTT